MYDIYIYIPYAVYKIINLICIYIYMHIYIYIHYGGNYSGPQWAKNIKKNNEFHPKHGPMPKDCFENGSTDVVRLWTLHQWSNLP